MLCVIFVAGILGLVIVNPNGLPTTTYYLLSNAGVYNHWGNSEEVFWLSCGWKSVFSLGLSSWNMSRWYKKRGKNAEKFARAVLKIIEKIGAPLIRDLYYIRGGRCFSFFFGKPEPLYYLTACRLSAHIAASSPESEAIVRYTNC